MSLGLWEFFWDPAAWAINTSLSVTEADDGLSGASVVLVGLSGTFTEANDALSSASAVLVTTSLAAIESDDALSAAMNTSSGVNADLSVTEANDTLSAAVPEIRSGGGFDPDEISKATERYRRRTTRTLTLRVKEQGDTLIASASVAPFENEDDEAILMLLAA